jgi:hypothetical protein
MPEDNSFDLVPEVSSFARKLQQISFSSRQIVLVPGDLNVGNYWLYLALLALEFLRTQTWADGFELRPL